MFSSTENGAGALTELGATQEMILFDSRKEVIEMWTIIISVTALVLGVLLGVAWCNYRFWKALR